MLVDLHLHEKTCSTDSFLSLEEIVSEARRRGLDGVCITDHDSMGLRDYAEDYARRTGFPIFVGVEYFSLQGDITAWGIDTFPDHRIDAQDFIDQVNRSGGFCVSCHPFRNNNRGLEENLRRVRGLHGVEVLNGSTTPEANRTALRFCREVSCHPFRNNNRGLEENLRRVRGLHGVEVLNGSTTPEANRTALRFCRELGLQAIGASDAHVRPQVGKYVTWLPERVTSLSDFVAQLHTCTTRPAIWNGLSYDVVDTF